MASEALGWVELDTHEGYYEGLSALLLPVGSPINLSRAFPYHT